MFFKRKKIKKTGEAIVAWARAKAREQFPDHYSQDVANEMDRLARFETIAVYMCLAMWLLQKEGDTHADVAEAAVDAMMAVAEKNLLHNGIPVESVEPYMKKLMAAFQGRMVAYSSALDKNDENLLAETLMRNQCSATRAHAEKVVRNVCYEAYRIALEKGVARWLNELLYAK